MVFHVTLIITRVNASGHLLPPSHTFTTEYSNTSDWTSPLFIT